MQTCGVKLIPKKLQVGTWEQNAQRLQQGFADGYDKIVIIGSDLIALESDDIIAAIENLDNNDIVIVLQKMVAITFRNEKIPSNLFEDKEWGTETVLKDTLLDIANLKYHLLQEKNDIDTYDDIKMFPF
jgi:glycosyltransferase A (GT-A) superfamily protein (DUF2064 family)